MIFGLPRGTQKCIKRVYHHWGRPLMGAILCHFGEVNAFFSILGPFWVQFGLLRGHFLTNLHRFLIMFFMSPCHLCFLFFSVFFGICGGSGGLVLLVILVLFVGGWVVVVCQDRNTTGQQHDGTVRQQHGNTERRQDVKTARQQDSMTKIQQHNNLTIQQPIDVARWNARSD